MDEPPTFDLTLEQAAYLYLTAAGVMCRLIDGDFPDGPFGAEIPRRVMTAGQASALIPIVVFLLAEKFPGLLDDDVLASAIHAGAQPFPTIN